MCSIVVRDALSCCPHDEAAGVRWLASDSYYICEPPTEVADYQAGCDAHKWHAVHTLETVLFGFTIAILSFMMAELLVLMAAVSPCVFFRHFWYILDFIIVAVSLSLEVVFKSIDDDNLATYVGLLVVFRCWRFVRISHGLMEVTAELTAEKYEDVIKMARELEVLMDRHEQTLAAKGDATEQWENESLTDIQNLSKVLADHLLATQNEENDEIRLNKLKKKIVKAVHSSHHVSHKDADVAVENTAVSENGGENGKPVETEKGN